MKLLRSAGLRNARRLVAGASGEIAGTPYIFDRDLKTAPSSFERFDSINTSLYRVDVFGFHSADAFTDGWIWAFGKIPKILNAFRANIFDASDTARFWKRHFHSSTFSDFSSAEIAKLLCHALQYTLDRDRVSPTLKTFELTEVL